MRPEFDLSLYLVTDPLLVGGRDLLSVVEEAIDGGVSLVQLRDPHASTRELIAIANGMKARLDPSGIPLIINDRVDVALAAGASGVHLGSSDMPAEAARSILGEYALIGLSIGSVEELRAERGALQFADYVGVGPVFSTKTKSDAGHAIGTACLSDMVDRLELPCVAIGGITVETAPKCIRAGAEGVAVVSAIVGSDHPREAARRFRSAIFEERDR